MQPPPHPCSARSLPGDNDSWQEEEEGGGRGSRVGGGVESGSLEGFTPFYLRHCLLRSGQGQVAGGGKIFKFSLKKKKKTVTLLSCGTVCVLLQVGLTPCSSGGQTVQMQIYCTGKEPSSYQTRFS